MKIKIVDSALFYIILISILTMAPEALAQGDRAFELGIRNYNKARYLKAQYHFEKALKSGLKEERLKFTKYAIKTMDAFKLRLEDIEKEEAAFNTKSRDEFHAKGLSLKHLFLARDLMQATTYLAMVEPHLKRAIGLDPKNVEAYLFLGNAYYFSMQYSKSVTSYEKAISVAVATPYAYKMAGDACVAIGDFDKAKKFYSDLIKVNDESVLRFEPSEIEKIKHVMRVLPETYKDINDLLKEERRDEAEAILKKRISLNQSDYIAMTMLGDISQDRGDRRTALRFFKTAIKTAPDYPIAHLYLGRLHYIMRKPEEAISELNIFKEKMSLLPKMDDDTKKMYISSLHYTSEVCFTLERYEEVLKQLEEILKLDPKEQDAYYNLGVYYYRHEHNRPKAYQSFKKAIDLDSTTDVAKNSKYAIEFMRSNPDSRVAPDLSFINKEYRD